MKKSALKELYLDYLEDRLDSGQRIEIEQLFVNDPSLKADYEAFVRCSLLSQSLQKEKHQAPAGFFNEVMEAIEPQASKEKSMARFFKKNDLEKEPKGSYFPGIRPILTLASLVGVITITSITFLRVEVHETFSTVGSHLGSDVGDIYTPQSPTTRLRTSKRAATIPEDSPRVPSLSSAPVGQPEAYDREISAESSFSTEEYNRIYENQFLEARKNPLSTFSIDVDTASYSNARRYLNRGLRPPKDAVRVEEFINYFDYHYPNPEDSAHPFSVTTELGECPWSKGSHLLHIGLRGKEIARDVQPPSNLVFLLDVSGSMNDPHKLPLLQDAFSTLVDQLSEQDRVGIVVYAGAAGVVLEPTEGSNKQAIVSAIRRLKAGGSTAGAQGIQLAYRLAERHFIPQGNNRVILATDGDFNVGVSSTSELIRLIEKKRDAGVFLTVLGFGTGNYKDHRMEQLADKGNGNYYYIDSKKEAEKVFIQDLQGTLFTIAKDVKIQIEFNPAHVKAYRLIGYENRKLKKEDFNNDKIDAGEIGSGHTVTALYEIIPQGAAFRGAKVDPLKYQENKEEDTVGEYSNELATLKLRYKKPESSSSKLITTPIETEHLELPDTSRSFRFSAAVAGFAMLLRDSEHKGASSYELAEDLAENSLGEDPFGLRKEFLTLIQKAKRIR